MFDLEIYFDIKAGNKQDNDQDKRAVQKLADDDELDARKEQIERLIAKEYDESQEGHRQKMLSRIVQYAVGKYRRP